MGTLRKLLFLICGILCLLGPAILLLIFLVFAPGPLERWVYYYTGTSFSKFQTGGVEGSFSLPFAMACHWWKIYIQRVAIETLCRTYNALIPALALSAITIVLSLFIMWATTKLRKLSSLSVLVEWSAFFALFLISAWVGELPNPMTLAAAVSLLYLLNFSLGLPLTSWVFQGGRIVCLTILSFSLGGVSHLFFPGAIFALLLRAIVPDKHHAQRWDATLARTWVCLISFPLFLLVAYSYREIPVSPHARCLITEKGLYDIVIDPVAHRLVVTQKEDGTGWALSLDTQLLLGRFSVPSVELEDIEIDPEQREIYHVDRYSGNILVIDADTFRVVRMGRTSFRSSGTTKIALDKSSNKLLISWENDNLFTADRDSLDCVLIGSPGNVNPLADESHGVVYLNSEFGSFLETLDLKQGKSLCHVESPVQGERMALSRSRSELYVPDPRGGTVWVYATPDLKLLRKIPSQFGVRPLAVDDKNGLLFSASVITGYLDITDLATGKKVQHLYVGNYGRIIQVDPTQRHAYVTLTKKGLYLVKY